MNKPNTHVTFSDLLQLIEADMSLHPYKAANLKSSIRRYLRAVNWTETMEASFPRVRKALAGSLPATLDVSKGTWANTRSDLKFVLTRYGVPTRAPLRKDLLPEWRQLRDMIDKDPSLIRGLSNFIHWCSRQNISPWDVSEEVMARYLLDLRERSLKKGPESLHRRVCVLWNKASSIYDKWPGTPVPLPSYRKTISLPWEAFPISFMDDLDHYQAFMSGEDLLSTHAIDKPRRPATLNAHREAFRRMASAMVHSGFSIEKLTSLKQLVRENNLIAGLRAYEAHLGNLKCPSVSEMLGCLISLAANYLRSDKQTLKMLRDIRGRTVVRQRGMTDKNMDRLRQFASPKNVGAFITIADTLLAERAKLKSSSKKALRTQTALMHEIMLIAPIRAKNLTTLHISNNFRRVGSGPTLRVFMILPSDEVKNHRDMEFEFPKYLINLLDEYLNKYRGSLLPKGTDNGWLFPGRDGQHKNQVSIGDQLCKAMLRLTGIKINPHLYRHIAAYLYLEANPGDYETVRLLLGHTSSDTTVMFYAGFSDTNACRHYADMLSERRISTNNERGK